MKRHYYTPENIKASVMLLAEPCENYGIQQPVSASVSTFGSLSVYPSDNKLTQQYVINVTEIDKRFAGVDTSVVASLYSDIDFLADAYELVNTEEIKSFLTRNPALVQDLSDARIEIAKRFGTIRPKIELIEDTELPDWKTLFVTIPHNLEFQQAFELLENWAFLRSKEFRQLVTITEELQ